MLYFVWITLRVQDTDTTRNIIWRSKIFVLLVRSLTSTCICCTYIHNMYLQTQGCNSVCTFTTTRVVRPYCWTDLERDGQEIETLFPYFCFSTCVIRLAFNHYSIIINHYYIKHKLTLYKQIRGAINLH